MTQPCTSWFMHKRTENRNSQKHLHMNGHRNTTDNNQKVEITQILTNG